MYVFVYTYLFSLYAWVISWITHVCIPQLIVFVFFFFYIYKFGFVFLCIIFNKIYHIWKKKKVNLYEIVVYRINQISILFSVSHAYMYINMCVEKLKREITQKKKF